MWWKTKNSYKNCVVPAGNLIQTRFAFSLLSSSAWKWTEVSHLSELLRNQLLNWNLYSRREKTLSFYLSISFPFLLQASQNFLLSFSFSLSLIMLLPNHSCSLCCTFLRTCIYVYTCLNNKDRSDVLRVVVGR